MTTPSHPTPPETAHNRPEMTVSELSASLKRTVEDAFGQVRVRGEISQPKVAGSGHCYLRLKDDRAVLDGVIWRGVMGRLSLRPEEGMEVIAEGRLSTYPGRSSYQIVIESLELAGEGALLKLLEERKRKLAAEGLFAAERKKPLPFLPRVIGLVTSPTGAVIRDILHRLADRFPVRVLLIPVRVQGEGAAGEVAAAVAAFNRLAPGPADGPRPPRPDLLIVARGGGSLEDLWAFNEEEVVRAVAASAIPVISAVGHETDTTLIDYAADRRAPTPTGAAEYAVPVRLELRAQVGDLGGRLDAGLARRLDAWAGEVRGLGRGIPPLGRLVEEAAQRLDDRAERLAQAMAGVLEGRRARLAERAARLPTPTAQISARETALGVAGQGLARAWATAARERATALAHLGGRLAAEPIKRQAERGEGRLGELEARLDGAAGRRLAALDERLAQVAARLEGASYKRVLERGYVAVTDAEGACVTAAGALGAGQAVRLAFHDGSVGAVVEGGSPPTAKPKPKPAAKAKPPTQGSLL
ncbi:exodeoxyribonuclease VII large subunit [Roseospirillum parvum]|uniref:Exodeoxyribonuclease 7 large subunit n=1 Tax=Roseospirillum parvum TaxID=83401 RepID=A0A1G7UI16_9PROT|nr:exodeoxyribonuclease VII large subunit [Roseospirillum parvum]SDG47196.1 exodeoxyribonuclease VII large subunit [Roseospirillum parvum]